MSSLQSLKLEDSTFGALTAASSLMLPQAPAGAHSRCVLSCCSAASVSQQDENRLLLQVKQEKADGEATCNLDLKVEVNISSECSLSSGECLGLLEGFLLSSRRPGNWVWLQRWRVFLVNLVISAGWAPLPVLFLWWMCSRGLPTTCCSCLLSQAVCPSVGGEPCEDSCMAAAASPPGATGGPTCRPWAQARSATAEERPGEGLRPSQPRVSGDMPWMQERVSHLGAAYAAAQQAQGAASAASGSFSSQSGADSLEVPPAMIFTGSAHEMAAFASPFDMASAAAAPPPPPPDSASTSKHRRSSASKEPLVCAVCGRMFPSSTTLKLHQRVHTGERPFTCPHCGKGFAQPSNLRVHLLIHTGERRYRCTLCGKSFLSSSHLKRHRTVHTQEKPYSCSRCGQAFSQMCSVRRHRQQSQCGL